jgi:hypothetical protein
MAAEVVHRSDHLPSCAIKPLFFTCDAGHLHWRLGYVGIDVESLPMRERLKIEWFWKHLSPRQQTFWLPYIRDIDSEIDEFIRATDLQDDETRQRLVKCFTHSETLRPVFK